MFLRLSYFEKIGDAGVRDGRTDRVYVTLNAASCEGHIKTKMFGQP